MGIIIVVAILGIVIYFIFIRNEYPKNFCYWEKEASAVLIQNERAVKIEKVKATADGFQTQDHGFIPWIFHSKNDNIYMFGDEEFETISCSLAENTIVGKIDGQSYVWFVETHSSYKELCECIEAKAKLRKLPYWNTKMQFMYYKIGSEDLIKAKMSGASYLEVTENCLFIDGHVIDWEHLVGTVFIDGEYRYVLLEDTIIKSLESNPNFSICMWRLVNV